MNEDGGASFRADYLLSAVGGDRLATGSSISFASVTGRPEGETASLGDGKDFTIVRDATFAIAGDSTKANYQANDNEVPAYTILEDAVYEGGRNHRYGIPHGR